MQVKDFDYELPEELIAQSPLDRRDNSRLLVVRPERFVGGREAAPAANELQTGAWEHAVFRELPRFLRSDDLLVVNDSRVIPARLYGRKVETGAEVELLLTQALSEQEWLALAKPAKRLKVGTVVEFSDHASAKVVEVRDGGIRRLQFFLDGSMEEFLNHHGKVPLPPYIHQPIEDSNRYQTVYASLPGSVAAPTAGLHFTEELLQQIRSMGVSIHHVTLHVGIGTFRPVSVDDVENHVMHSEWYEIPETTAAAINEARREGRRVIAVGTTAMRTLESAGSAGEVVAGANETDIFIYPGYRFRVVDALITNFHLPKSTLLMLVSAFMGTDLARRTYALAVAERYRFFSFGDAMFITSRGESL